ncbi:hypothetical protein ACE2AJ_00525 [Aquihabitans daechungensis]|uniref:hypothetical protein n=1 Tax=Aquihabitans daechungensis TaxID=1052257 RepID=UPI003B9EF11F
MAIERSISRAKRDWLEAVGQWRHDLAVALACIAAFLLYRALRSEPLAVESLAQSLGAALGGLAVYAVAMGLYLLLVSPVRVRDDALARLSALVPNVGPRASPLAVEAHGKTVDLVHTDEEGRIALSDHAPRGLFRVHRTGVVIRVRNLGETGNFAATLDWARVAPRIISKSPVEAAWLDHDGGIRTIPAGQSRDLLTFAFDRGHASHTRTFQFIRDQGPDAKYYSVDAQERPQLAVVVRVRQEGFDGETRAVFEVVRGARGQPRLEPVDMPSEPGRLQA